MDKKIINLKKRLEKSGVKGLALDIDETLSFTIGYMIEQLIKKFGNPENLTPKEIARKYRHTDNIPYWNDDEARKVMDGIINSNKIQEKLPLIENANKVVQEINKTVPIVAYITVRPTNILKGTKTWLKKHGFPEAELITKPINVSRLDGNKWKAEVLEFLYPQVIGIVDDNPSLTSCLTSKYKGTVYLYDNTVSLNDHIRVIPCQDWKTVEKMIKINK